MQFWYKHTMHLDLPHVSTFIAAIIKYTEFYPLSFLSALPPYQPNEQPPLVGEV
jgi:hypothetical protein